MTLPDNVDMGGDSLEYVRLPDGTHAVRPIRKATNKPLERYFAADAFRQFNDGNLKRFLTEDNERYEKIKRLSGKYLQRYEHADGTGMYLYSANPGSGKTMLSCLLAAALTRKYGVSSQAISVIGMINRLQETFNVDELSAESVMNPLKAVDVLVLDEVGAEKYSEFREDTLYDLINHRLNTKRTTFFTSNMRLDDLEYHNRIKSRIIEMSIQLQMPNIDMRTEIRSMKNKEIFKRFNS